MLLRGIYYNVCFIGKYVHIISPIVVVLSSMFVCLFQGVLSHKFTQAAAPQPVDQDQWRRDNHHQHPPAAEHDQVRLPRLWVHSRSLLPETGPGDSPGDLPRVPGQRPL